MNIPLTDLVENYHSIKEEIDCAVMAVFEKTDFILGSAVTSFEQEFAAYSKTKYAVGVANGTDALLLALLACNVKTGDEVITTPFTFIATTEAIVHCGAKPVFVDIDPKTYNIDANKIEGAITPRTKAILPVHLYGMPAQIDKIMEIAKKHNLKVVEDCAQAFSASCQYNGQKFRPVGSMGDAGCFSFFPAKNMGCFGDGGMVTTNNDSVKEKVTMLRNHGSKVRYFHDIDGFNSRLDTVQAAILRVKMKYINQWTAKRNECAKLYATKLSNFVIVPSVSEEGITHSFNYYTIRFSSKEQRDKVQNHLTKNGVANQIYYPLALHMQSVHANLGYKKGDYPQAETVCDTVLSLPIYPELTEDKINYICKNIIDAIRVNK